MTKLPTEQLLYLLYTVAYSKDSPDGTVTQGTVREYLPKASQKNADQLCDTLLKQQLLESPKRRRISVTQNGMKTLVQNLQNTDYKFESAKGIKVLNTLLDCFKYISSQGLTAAIDEEMDFDTFVEKFKELYFEERKRQERRGLAVIRSQEICQKFMESNRISESLLNQYFDKLKTTDQIFYVVEKNEEIIQWAE